MIKKIILTSRIELQTKEDIPDKSYAPLLLKLEQHLNQMVIDLKLQDDFKVQVYPRFHFQFKEGMIDE